MLVLYRTKAGGFDIGRCNGTAMSVIFPLEESPDGAAHGDTRQPVYAR
jgi:hypothetical protein